MQVSYFHVSDREWAEGQIINPGNFGATIARHIQGPLLTTVVGHDLSPSIKNYMWEAALEATRIAWKPSAPSRTNVVFLSETVDLARRFRDKYKQSCKIYQCVPTAYDARRHVGDCGVFEDVHEPLISVIGERCKRYWTEPPKSFPELLWEGSVAIVGEVV